MKKIVFCICLFFRGISKTCKN